jgi:hypothetical protein
MSPRIWSFVSAFVVAAPMLAGCAGEDAEAGEAAYPPIGYTPPAHVAASDAARAPAAAPALSAAPVQAAPVEGGQGAWQWAGAPDNGGGDGDDPGAGADGAGDGDGSGSPPGAGYAAGPGDGSGAPGVPPPIVGDGDGPGAPGAAGYGPGGRPPGAGAGQGYAEPGYADTDPSALTDFHSALDPYGAWVDDPTYGTVWVPSSNVVGSDFTPYVSGGHWGYDSDYTWVSDYDWGWAPFHYGRWVYAAGPGWAWIPGREYAGAWVSWRYGDDDWSYVGWAPLAPTWCWRGGVAVGLGFVPRAPYAFVGTGELFAPHVGTRIVTGPQVGVIANHSRAYVPPSGGSGRGRVTANPSVGGPLPSDLHIAADSVARSPANDRGLMQARAFARPSTAVSLGARAPSGSVAAGYAARGPAGAYGAYAQRGTGGAVGYAPRASVTLGGAGWVQGRGPTVAYRSPEASHFGGRMGGGFAGSATSAPPMRSYSLGGGAGARPYYGGAARVGMPSGGFRSSGPPATFRGPAQTFRAAPSGGFSGGRAPSFSSGSFHSASGGGSFHGGGGGGGHGGGRR